MLNDTTRLLGLDGLAVVSVTDGPAGPVVQLQTADEQARTDFATFRAEVAACDAAVAGRGLDETFMHPRGQCEISIRWVYTHMIEEYARHNGHADLIRERIDGVTGG